MNKKSMLPLALVSVVMAGCCATSPICQFRKLVDRGSEALLKEGSAYHQLEQQAPLRGEAPVTALQNWSATLKDPSAIMVEAEQKLRGETETKIRTNKDVQVALVRFKSHVDEVLSRNYAGARLKLVPPWRLGEAQAASMESTERLKTIASYFAGVFAEPNTHAAQSYELDVLQDMQIVDTYQDCIDYVAAASADQAMSGYCVNAARVACGHQIDVSCVQSRVREALASNLCPDLKTEMIRVASGMQFNPNDYVRPGEELKDWRFGAVIREPNTKRNVATFCPADEYDAALKGVGSKRDCGLGQRVRIYGYDQDRHVQVEIENVRHSDSSHKDVIVDVYAEGSFVGTRVVRADGRGNNVYTFTVNERAFQAGSRLKLQFRSLLDRSVRDSESGPSATKKVDWIVDAQIDGQDVPYIMKREVVLTKYTPNSWVAGIVVSCRATSPVLR